MTRSDVVVVGAGFTGLVAAVELAKAGLTVEVLEARDRVGGKVESAVLPNGRRIDTGGQFFCRDMTELTALAKACGKTPAMTFADGETLIEPAMDPAAGRELWEQVDALRNRMGETNLDDPHLARLTVADWVALQDVPEQVGRNFLRMVKGLWCRSPDEIAFTYLASNDRRVTNTHPEMEMFLPGTAHAMAEELAGKLSGRLRLNSKVTRIAYGAEGVEVWDGTTRLLARQLILALPPAMARRLTFEPSLPRPLEHALNAWQSGYAIKVQLSYARPFWRAAGLNGTVIWQEPQGLFACDTSHGDHAALVLFIGGPLAKRWHGMTREALREVVRDHLAAAFGPAGGDFTHIHIRDWVDDPWSGGAYSDVITDLEAGDAEAILTAGIPPIHFASSELASSYPGYMEGAIVSGKAVASRILQSGNATTE